MKKGLYGGGTFGTSLGFGGGLYADSYGNLYPQLYFGSPGVGVSAGYSNDLEGLLTGPSAGGTFGRVKAGPNVGTSGGAGGFGFGTPGVGATYGFGPYNIRNIGESFRPTTDEFGQPFPGSDMLAQPISGNNSESQGGPDTGNNPVIKFFDSLRPRSDEYGNAFPGPQSSGGVLKYGPVNAQLTTQVLAGPGPDQSAEADLDSDTEAPADVRRLGRRVIRA